MTVQEWEKDFYGNNVTITTRDNECVIYRIRDDSGDSVLTRFEVYPGIALIYNDVHTDYISIKELVGYENILEINHCREGRIEFESSEGECLYVKKGDMAINMKAGVKSYSYFPQSHYHGVTIEIDFDKIEKNQNMIMKEMQLSPKILQDKFCNHKQCIVLHEKQEFEHLFSEIYCVPEQIKKSYYKIKVMEILLFLFALDTTKEKIENRYFNKNLVAKVKEIHQYMLNHIDEKLTIACLADKHQISATNLKKYFKEIYGLSIYAYLKEKRIQKAAELLRETNHEIGKIAELIYKSGNYASQTKAVLTCGVFSMWAWGNFIPLFFNREAYWATRQSFGEEYITTLNSLMPMWLCPVLLIASFVFGIIGGMFGKALLKKHFKKAGIV